MSEQIVKSLPQFQDWDEWSFGVSPIESICMCLQDDRLDCSWQYTGAHCVDVLHTKLRIANYIVPSHLVPLDVVHPKYRAEEFELFQKPLEFQVVEVAKLVIFPEDLLATDWDTFCYFAFIK